MKKVIGITSCILGFILIVFGIVMKVKEDTTVSIIEGTDGPTAIFYAGKLNGI